MKLQEVKKVNKREGNNMKISVEELKKIINDLKSKK